MMNFADYIGSFAATCTTIAFIPQAIKSYFTRDLSGISLPMYAIFTSMNDSLTVLRVIEGGPSDKAGLKPGDRILKVDNDSIAGMRLKNNEYVTKIIFYC